MGPQAQGAPALNKQAGWLRAPIRIVCCRSGARVTVDQTVPLWLGSAKPGPPAEPEADAQSPPPAAAPTPRAPRAPRPNGPESTEKHTAPQGAPQK